MPRATDCLRASLSVTGAAGREANNGPRTTDNGQQCMWRFRGSPFYLARQAKRLGVAQELAHASRHNAEIFRIATLASQLCEHWHRARKENGFPVFYAPELERLKCTLERCEIEVQKLHILAAAADEMLLEARAAFGLEKPKRLFEVMSDLESNILPLGDGTVGIADDQLEPALSESG